MLLYGVGLDESIFPLKSHVRWKFGGGGKETTEIPGWWGGLEQFRVWDTQTCARLACFLRLGEEE